MLTTAFKLNKINCPNRKWEKPSLKVINDRRIWGSQLTTGLIWGYGMCLLKKKKKKSALCFICIRSAEYRSQATTLTPLCDDQISKRSCQMSDIKIFFKNNFVCFKDDTCWEKKYTNGQYMHMRRCLVLLAIRKWKIKTIVKYHFTPTRIAIIKKMDNNKCWWKCRDIETFTNCWWKCKRVQLLWKDILAVS